MQVVNERGCLLHYIRMFIKMGRCWDSDTLIVLVLALRSRLSS